MRGLYRVDDGEDEEYLGASVEQETVGLQRKKKDGPAVGMAVATDTWRPHSQEEAASQRIVEGEPSESRERWDWVGLSYALGCLFMLSATVIVLLE